MQIDQALATLGIERVIWIDDRFCQTPAELAKLLTISVETTRSCQIPELGAALSVLEVDVDTTMHQITQVLADLPKARVAEIRGNFFLAVSQDDEFPANELPAEAMDLACELLGVSAEDRWTFDKADRELPAVCAGGDASIGYIVDLNEAGGSPSRGLDVLRALSVGRSAGTTFILTHEADTAGEGQKEIEIGTGLSDLAGLGFPICVIAKERLYDKADDVDGMVASLRIGVKRAGLRRSMHEVLSAALDRMHEAVDEASERLLRIPPERLDSHVFERGYKEGVSELHVVERAIGAHFGSRVREFFATDQRVQASVRRLRSLRDIPLQTPEDRADALLGAFRLAEVWEPEELVNGALAPIACGDVFELDKEEKQTKSSDRKYIVLGQPCDISLRPDKTARAQDTAFLVPLRKKNKVGRHDPKAPLLPFVLYGERWACDFRKATTVRLSVLDLASFRTDGRVRVDHEQTAPAELLAAQQVVYDARTALANNALSDAGPCTRHDLGNIELLLTFDGTDLFKHISKPVLEERTTIRDHGISTTMPRRLTWRLRRCGRVRMPYAAALLDQYMAVMSRQAFDLDFMLPLTTAESGDPN